jgi:hypothetical protein
VIVDNTLGRATVLTSQVIEGQAIGFGEAFTYRTATHNMPEAVYRALKRAEDAVTKKYLEVKP